jgi:transposase
MSQPAATPCPNCERLHQQVRTLEELVAQQQQALANLSEQVRRLQEQLASAGKDSSTSSKPPSSDIVKPPKSAPPQGQDKRRQGGQPGHPRHTRVLLPAQALNGGAFDHRLDCCPDCGCPVQPLDRPPRLVQQIDVPAAPIVAQEHRAHACWCPACGKAHYAPLPEHIEAGGLVGPRLTTLIAYLKGACHASFSTIRKFLKDVAQVTLSRGQLAKVIAKVSAALAEPYEELLTQLPDEALLNVDETGHKDKGDRMWTWCFRASLYTLFKIDPTRKAEVLIEVLGEEFAGVLGCDYFSAYRRYMREFGVPLQFCLAHLIRDVKFLTTLASLDEVLYGTRLLLGLKTLFGVIHQREQLPAEQFAEQLRQARELILRVGTQEVPDSAPCQAMAKRLRKHGAAYFTFITTPGVEPTNNLAEQAIRFVVIDRVLTQGTRSTTGQRWCERIWTVVATCAQQGRSVFEYLARAVRAAFGEGEAPSLLAAER